MEMMGNCTICGGTGKLFTCMLCGRLVCRNCMDPSTGACIQCARGRGTAYQGTRID
ncbi:MAG TPA: orotate phosphoribosyltransferase [Methanosarcinaceae archaeon]|nr:orotate phosphoribosyltransferase [Methanosarcinaceae archaeon]